MIQQHILLFSVWGDGKFPMQLSVTEEQHITMCLLNVNTPTLSENGKSTHMLTKPGHDAELYFPALTHMSGLLPSGNLMV